MFRLVLTAAVALAASAPVVAADAVRFTPLGNWTLDYRVDRCRLSRSFSGDGETIDFAIERFEPGDAFAMAISGSAIRYLPGIDAAYKFDGDNQYRPSAVYLVDGVPSGHQAIFRNARLFNFAELEAMGPGGKPAPFYEIEPFGRFRITADMERQRSGLVIRQGRREFHLRTGGWGAPMAALRECTTDLINSWGLDVAEQRRLVSLPVPLTDPDTWLRPSDFPTSRFLRNDVEFRLLVDADGAAGDCVIYEPFASETFGQQLCEKLRVRARFQPAKDENGNPVASFWRSKAELLR